MKLSVFCCLILGYEAMKIILGRDSDSEFRPRFNFITSTKHQQKKKLARLQLQILPELQLQNLDQTLCSKSEQAKELSKGLEGR